jgi:hypothetical protein
MPAQPTNDLRIIGGQDLEAALSASVKSYVRTATAVKERPADKPKSFNPENLEDGFYEVQGRFYKVIVAVHGSGRKYAKLWNFDTGEWEYNRSGIREIRPEHRMTAERRIEVAKAYGLNPDSPLYGRCWMCHRPLTDETSISLGIGPICKDR